MEGSKKYIVTCPVCGKILFRCTASNAEIQCHKCHSDLTIEVEGSRITGDSRSLWWINRGNGTACKEL